MHFKNSVTISLQIISFSLDNQDNYIPTYLLVSESIFKYRCLDSSVTKLSFCTREVRCSSPGLCKLLFFVNLIFLLIFIGAASSNPPGGGSKIAPCQHPSTLMPPMPGGLYGGPEHPQGGGEWRKVAEIGVN